MDMENFSGLWKKFRGYMYACTNEHGSLTRCIRIIIASEASSVTNCANLRFLVYIFIYLYIYIFICQ